MLKRYNIKYSKSNDEKRVVKRRFFQRADGWWKSVNVLYEWDF